jgi:CheY-like chemotaxis protein
MERALFDWSESSGLNVEISAGEPPVGRGDAERRSNGKGDDARRKMSGNRVLLVGKSRELALYRAEVLRDRGFEVRIPTDTKESITEISRGAYDVAVLSYTLSSDEVQQLAELVRQACPDCPLVTISKSGRLDRMVSPDATVLADDGPSALIKALRRLQRHH